MEALGGTKKCNENHTCENIFLTLSIKPTVEAAQIPSSNVASFALGQRFHKLHDSAALAGLQMHPEPLWNFSK